jgi:rsbT co-antagonist protein RsbR
MNSQLIPIIRDNQEEIVSRWLEEIQLIGKQKSLRVVSEQLFLNTSKEFIDLIITKIEHTTEERSISLNDFSERIIKLGWPLSYITEGLQKFRGVIQSWVQEKTLDPKSELDIVTEMNRLIDPIINHMVNNYSGSWEHTVSMQKMALQELSAPLIPVFENITIMPLIGTIDTDRAKRIMENLLQGVVKHRAEVVLIDITGVPVVDTMVAQHIIQAVEAVRLVGTKCLIVGIRPEIAQTIVNLGIDLSHIITKNSLRNGIEAALYMTNRKIVLTELGVE